VAAVPRVIVAVAYRPALFFPDSWNYIAHAYGSTHFGGIRTVGYSLALDALSWFTGRSLLAATTLQHLVGIAIGLIVYALLIRRGVPRMLATLAAGFVLLEGYSIVLEQKILAETFFTFAIVASVYLLVVARRPSVLALAGVLLAAAITMRAAGVFIAPIWVAYAVYRHRRPPLRALAPSAGLLLTLLAFTAVNKHETGQVAWTGADGWFLYGRIGSIADCARFEPPAGTRRLCQPGGPSDKEPAYFVWAPDSPANRLFPRGPTTPGSDTLLRRFAIAVVTERPANYLAVVASDTLRYFGPAASDTSLGLKLPTRQRTGEWFDPKEAAKYFPDFRPRVHSPAAAARAYVTAIHFPGPLLALLLLPPLALVPARIRRRAGPPRHGAEVLLLTGGAAALIVGATATSGFVVRYMIPAVPLLVAGAALALAELERGAG
jgi:hypothetical protein